ncbi:MAG: prohibitin family protein [Candidatus Nomurabacteria bacterium]|jgi:regulator of protease activity HflC (stomatin/prohibitin superfamily)|nr:prohibitin family protein [Candidatus Nomurabacteria bacterium]
MANWNNDDYDATEVKARIRVVAKIIIGAVVLLLALMAFLLCTVTVKTGRVAVVTEFGTITGSQSTGFHFKAPWQDYNMVDVTQIQVEDEYSTATKDNQSLPQRITAQIQIDPSRVQELYAKFLGNHVAGIVAPTLYSGFKSATAGFTLEDAIANRAELENKMLDTVELQLAQYGINVLSIQIKEVVLPANYAEAVEKRKVAEQDKLTAEIQRQTAEIDAQTNEVIANSLHEENFRQRFYDKWDGKLPLYMGGEGGLDMLLPSIDDQ